MNGKHVPVENKKLIIEILRWAKIITDAGGGRIMFVPKGYTAYGEESDGWED